MYFIRKGDLFMYLEGLYEYPAWTSDHRLATPMPKWKAYQMAQLEGGEVLKGQ